MYLVRCARASERVAGRCATPARRARRRRGTASRLPRAACAKWLIEAATKMDSDNKGTFVARARVAVGPRALSNSQGYSRPVAAQKAKRPQGRAKGPTRPSPWASAPTSTRSRPTARSMARPWRARAPRAASSASCAAATAGSRALRRRSRSTRRPQPRPPETACTARPAASSPRLPRPSPRPSARVCTARQPIASLRRSACRQRTASACPSSSSSAQTERPPPRSTRTCRTSSVRPRHQPALRRHAI